MLRTPSNFLPVQKPLAAEVPRVAKMKPRPYQVEAERAANDAWNKPGIDNVLLVLPTGAGKTVTFSGMMHKEPGASCAVAHRQELVGQISLALAREGVRHRIIAPKGVIKFCVDLQLTKVGASFYDPSAKSAVAGVDTLIRRKDESFRRWAEGISLWVMDEAHHVLRKNKWGKGVAMFPNARGLGVTATPCRADGNGLGRHAEGVFDYMVEGPTMRELINKGYLTDYRIVAPRTEDLDLHAVPVGDGGDYQKKALANAVRKSKLVGDVVKEYKRFAMGQPGVTFATDLEQAQEICDQFNAEGVPAAMVHGGSTAREREEATRELAEGKILNLVNVDLFGEGFDLPAISVVSMARPTKSFSLYTQQFGRALRLMIEAFLMAQWDDFTDEERRAHIAASVKPKALIIDHVGNTDQLAGGHPLPDALIQWSLDARERNGGSGQAAEDVVPTRTCTNPLCLSVYERTHLECPFCGEVPKRAQRSGPEYVDGDLTELDDETLARMRGEVTKLHKTVQEYSAELIAKRVPEKHRYAMECRYETKLSDNEFTQEALGTAIEWWAGVHRHNGLVDRQIMRKFYYTFGIDVLSAQALESTDALMLADRVTLKLQEEYPRNAKDV